MASLSLPPVFAMLGPRRKKELIGVLCIAVAVLLALAFVSYTPADRASVSALVSSAEASGGPGVQNWLGLIGAFLAWVFVPNFMGYPVLALCGVIGWVGVRLVRHQPLAPLAGPTLNIMGLAVFSCILLGWIGVAFDLPMVRWGGALGMSLAGLFVRLLGIVGTFLILVAIAVVGGLLFSEGSVQGAADRFAELATNAAYATWHRSQQAVRWARARYTDRQPPHEARTAPEAPPSDDPASAAPKASSQEEEAGPPSVKDPTAPRASGFRLVRTDAEDEARSAESSSSESSSASAASAEKGAPASSESEASPAARSSSSDPPDIARPPGADDATDAPVEKAAPPSETADEADEEDDVIRFDDVKSRIRQVQERIQQKRARRERAAEAEPDDATDAPPNAETDASTTPPPDTFASEPSPEASKPAHPSPPNDPDALFEEAARIVVRRQQGSASLLQRELSISYTRAGRVVDQLEAAGIVGPFAGTQARTVLVQSEDELDRLLAQM
ncbi:MAG: DNA translocase FtsK 4TM domain-containing protein [Longimonas sp.]